MEIVFIIMVGILFLLAITDLVVGVSNDAVNFLVSAIGSKAAPFTVIMIVAGLGVLFGATFSNGMMEVARKGIFHPEFFSFNDIMIIFLAVMLTDIILLDVFNTFGMPTSTTVSIVFELLGAAVAVSLIIILKNNGSYIEISNYINSAKALAIIGGILLSVVVAFSVGAFVQYLSRLLFSFNYKKTYKNFGAIWGGIAITAITYFIMIKGLKGSSFAGKGTDIYSFVTENTITIILLSFVCWSIILAVFQFIFKINILKIIVLVGTFALAMAFAGNDLVNFIGVPLAGFASYQEWAASGTPADSFLMDGLSGKVGTPTLYLLLAGLIMVITLFVSKKAKSVTETSLNLSRQEEGYERFESSIFSRSVVRSSINFGKITGKIFPNPIKNFINNRFDTRTVVQADKEQSFDLIRASVNLMVASILISIGTSLKLPLSTTYVTFMVAMGTSLADKAWGRESAVYRVSGVLSVIGGWFITAFVAFTVAFIFALLINLGGIIAIALILMLAIIALFHTKKTHKEREKQKNKINENEETEFATENIYKQCSVNVIDILSDVTTIYNNTIKFLTKEDRKMLKVVMKENNEINKKSKYLKDNIYRTLQKLRADSIETGPYYVQVLDYLREITHALHYVVNPSFVHIDNNHSGLIQEQTDDLANISVKLSELTKLIIYIIKNKNYNKIEKVLELQKELLDFIKQSRKKHIKLIKNKEIGTRNSILYLNLLAESKNIVLYMINLAKSQRDFVIEQKL